MSKRVEAKLWLPIFKQGDDLFGHVRNAGNDFKRGLVADADHLIASVKTLMKVAERVEKGP
jgi:hypothetical protein